jgi:hypothetical protein
MTYIRPNPSSGAMPSAAEALSALDDTPKILYTVVQDRTRETECFACLEEC